VLVRCYGYKNHSIQILSHEATAVIIHQEESDESPASTTCNNVAKMQLQRARRKRVL